MCRSSWTKSSKNFRFKTNWIVFSVHKRRGKIWESTYHATNSLCSRAFPPPCCMQKQRQKTWENLSHQLCQCPPRQIEGVRPHRRVLHTHFVRPVATVLIYKHAIQNQHCSCIPPLLHTRQTISAMLSSDYSAATHNITYNSPCTSTYTTHSALPNPKPSTTLLCTQLTNTRHSWYLFLISDVQKSPQKDANFCTLI